MSGTLEPADGLYGQDQPGSGAGDDAVCRRRAGGAVADAAEAEVGGQNDGVGGVAGGEGMTLGLWFSTESTYSPARKRSL